MRPSSRAGGRWARSRLAAPLACLALLTAGGTACGPATQTALPESPSATESAALVPESGAPTSTAEVDVARPGVGPAVVRAVRYASHETYDRLVIDLEGDIPGYSVRWVDEFVEAGSGKPLEVRGGAYLQLTLFPANAHEENGELTWKGGPVYQADLRNLTEVVRTGDFESRVGIGLVLARQAAFQLTEASSPNRLVLDVAH
ncbi:AMIN-like domain-containing (lipo)protein [Nonomuraea sp. 10N515B]|uniref:AMIN-like domain-containing (lipo)protein n=1 Tax=Nonomuraea sp. 10N515B TaxID=3457422 RepID=UPI003FCD8FDB